MSRRALAIVAILVLAGVLGWVLFVVLPAHDTSKPPATMPGSPAAATSGAQAADAARKITATLYYVSADGLALTGVQREVPYGATPAEQARAIIEAQVAPAAAPLVSAIPHDTKVRNVFVTDRGEAFVDLSPEVAANHPGGSLAEILTVYTIVDALTVNLPAVTRVQVLVGGKEVDTLAGHVDLRQPLAKSLEWIAHDTH